MYQIRNVTKQYGRRTVLDIGDLQLDKTMIYSLLGPNGSGKTTLLEILALLDRPDTGEVIYDGRRIEYASGNLHRFRRQIVLVQQNPVLFSTSVFKNLEFGLKVRGIDVNKRKKRIDDALDLVDMREFRHAPAHTLSGGETQRIAIAMALACSPRVLLFDEPFASVDLENQVAIERIITQIHDQSGIFVIFTSHNMEQASRLSRKVISLSNGKPVFGWIHNLFFGHIEEGVEGSRRCRIQGTLELEVDSDRTGNVRLSIDPLQIRIMPKVSKDLENPVKVKIVQITDEGDLARVTADAGVLLHVVMPKAAFRAAPLALGDTAFIHVPFTAIHIHR